MFPTFNGINSEGGDGGTIGLSSFLHAPCERIRQKESVMEMMVGFMAIAA
jgi:hypothetical protein